MMGLSGLEPPTSRLSGVRSNRLSYNPLMGPAATYSPVSSPIQYLRPIWSSPSCSGWERVLPHTVSPPEIFGCLVVSQRSCRKLHPHSRRFAQRLVLLSIRSCRKLHRTPTVSLRDLLRSPLGARLRFLYQSFCFSILACKHAVFRNKNPAALTLTTGQ